MQRIFIFTIITILCLPIASRAMTLSGQLKQGSMAIGNVKPGATVYFDGKQIRVSPEYTSHRAASSSIRSPSKNATIEFSASTACRHARLHRRKTI
jgi:hypothetical protein